MSKIITDFSRPSQTQIDAFKNISAATAHAAAGNIGAVSSAIKALFPGWRLVGPALTVKTPAGDNLTIHAALQLAQSGDVIVVDAGDYPNQGSFGDMMATVAISRGIAGLATNGGVRDIATLRQLDFPVFSRAVAINGTVKKHFGAINHPITFGGIIVHPGDLILGDDDGIVVIPQDDIDNVLQAAQQRQQKEAQTRAAIINGSNFWQMKNFNALLKANHIDIEL